jgi:hypothetical protein
MRFASSYTHVADPLAVLIGAVAIPDWVVSSLDRLDYLIPGEIEFQQGSGTVGLFTTVGTVKLHKDHVTQPAKDNVTLGLVLCNQPGAMLRDRRAAFPLPEGSIYRIDPRRRHGTCLPGGRHTRRGRFVFLTYDTPAEDEIAPQQFASWCMESVRAHLG